MKDVVFHYDTTVVTFEEFIEGKLGRLLIEAKKSEPRKGIVVVFLEIPATGYTRNVERAISTVARLAGVDLRFRLHGANEINLSALGKFQGDTIELDLYLKGSVPSYLGLAEVLNSVIA